jgi:ketosteroid isomerase-like protein
MEQWELSARESIRELVARYNASGDSGRFDELMELFWDDAEMELSSADGPDIRRGIDEIREIFTGTAQRWRADKQPASSAIRHHVRHCVSTLVIDLDDTRHARGYCYFHVIMPHGLDHWGRYFDRFEERDGQWRFLRRRVIREGGVDLLASSDG